MVRALALSVSETLPGEIVRVSNQLPLDSKLDIPGRAITRYRLALLPGLLPKVHIQLLSELMPGIHVKDKDAWL